MRVDLYKNPEFRKYIFKFVLTYIILIAIGALCIFYRQFLFLGIIVVVSFVTLLLSFEVYARNIYSNLHTLIYGTEKIIKGEYDVNLMEETEGEVSILAFQINQMSGRIKLSYEEIEKEKLALKRWISDISHQLKTPLSVIKMFNEILSDEVSQKEHSDSEFLEDILLKSSEEIENMDWLIQAILKLSKLEAGSVNMNMKKADIRETLRRAIESSINKNGNRKHNISVDIPPNEVLITHDTEWLAEAFKNVINNAILYTPERKNIKISLRRAETFAAITVDDEGNGIPEKDVVHIFERFYRGENADDEENEQGVKGTGIGLALSKLIIDYHNGIIDVSSKVGQGTKIIIKFAVKG